MNCNFGHKGDLGGISLCINGKNVIDRDRNLKGIKDARINGNVCIVGDLKLDGAFTTGNIKSLGNVIVCGNLDVTEKVTISDDTKICGDLFVCGSVCETENWEHDARDPTITLPSYPAGVTDGHGDLPPPTSHFDMLTALLEENPEEHANVMALIEANRGLPRSYTRAKSSRRAVAKDRAVPPALGPTVILNDTVEWAAGNSYVITSPGNYILDEDFSFSPDVELEHAIIVNFHDGSLGADTGNAIVIDFDGFTLSQSGNVSGIDAVHFGLPTVSNLSFHQVAVQNGNIQGFTGAGVWAFQFAALVDGPSTNLSFCDLNIDGCGELTSTNKPRLAEAAVPLPLFGSGIVLNPGLSILPFFGIVPGFPVFTTEYEDVTIQNCNVTNAKGGEDLIFGFLGYPSMPICVSLCDGLVMDQVKVEGDRSTTDSYSIFVQNCTNANITNIDMIDSGGGLTSPGFFFGFPRGGLFVVDVISQLAAFLTPFPTSNIVMDKITYKNITTTTGPSVATSYGRDCIAFVGDWLNRGNFDGTNISVSNITIDNVTDTEAARAGLVVTNATDVSVDHVNIKNITALSFNASLFANLNRANINDITVKNLLQTIGMTNDSSFGVNFNLNIDTVLKNVVIKDLTLQEAGGLSGFSSVSNTDGCQICDVHIEDLKLQKGGDLNNRFVGIDMLCKHITIKNMRNLGNATTFTGAGTCQNVFELDGINNADPIQFGDLTIDDIHIEDMYHENREGSLTVGLNINLSPDDVSQYIGNIIAKHITVKNIRGSSTAPLSTGFDANTEATTIGIRLDIGAGDANILYKASVENVRGAGEEKNPCGISVGKDARNWTVQRCDVKDVIQANDLTQGIATGVLIAPGAKGIKLDRCTVQDVESKKVDGNVVAGVSIGCNGYHCDVGPFVGEVVEDVCLDGVTIMDISSTQSEAAGVFSEAASTLGIILRKTKVERSQGITPIGARSAGIAILNSPDAVLEQNPVKASDRGFLLTGSTATVTKNKAQQNTLSGFEDGAGATTSIFSGNKAINNGDPCTNDTNYAVTPSPYPEDENVSICC